MYRTVVLLLVCVMCWAQSAKELLRTASEMVTTASPSVQVAALLYQDGAAGSGALQGRVVRTAAAIDVEKAIEMAPMVPVQERTEALERIVLAVGQKRLDRAVEVVEQSAGQGGYACRAADILISKLADDDSRRESLFASATAALAPNANNMDFVRLLARQWRNLPGPLVDGAVKRQEERQALAAALKIFAEGRLSMKAPDSDNLSTNRSATDRKAPDDPQAAARIQMMAIPQSKAQEALVLAGLAGKDAQLSVSRAAEVPDPIPRANALAEIAQLAAGKNPATAKSVIRQAITVMKAIKNPEATAGLWAVVAGSAKAAKDQEAARDALDKGLVACAALYRLDSNAGDPNEAPRENWPSMQHFRNLLYGAANINGTETALLLVKVNDPDLQLMGRIEIARSLMGKPRGDLQI